MLVPIAWITILLFYILLAAIFPSKDSPRPKVQASSKHSIKSWCLSNDVIYENIEESRMFNCLFSFHCEILNVNSGIDSFYSLKTEPVIREHSLSFTIFHEIQKQGDEKNKRFAKELNGDVNISLCDSIFWGGDFITFNNFIPSDHVSSRFFYFYEQCTHANRHRPNTNVDATDFSFFR